MLYWIYPFSALIRIFFHATVEKSRDTRVETGFFCLIFRLADFCQLLGSEMGHIRARYLYLCQVVGSFHHHFNRILSTLSRYVYHFD